VLPYSVNAVLYAFPAGAGMNRARSRGSVICTRVPRRRGDEPAAAAAPHESELRSPQARG